MADNTMTKEAWITSLKKDNDKSESLKEMRQKVEALKMAMSVNDITHSQVKQELAAVPLKYYESIRDRQQIVVDSTVAFVHSQVARKSSPEIADSKHQSFSAILKDLVKFYKSKPQVRHTANGLNMRSDETQAFSTFGPLKEVAEDLEKHIEKRTRAVHMNTHPPRLLEELFLQHEASSECHDSPEEISPDWVAIIRLVTAIMGKNDHDQAMKEVYDRGKAASATEFAYDLVFPPDDAETITA